MKYLILIFILVSNLAAASSRQDDTALNFTRTSVKLIKADGYSKNLELGKWIKNKNLINDKPANSIIEKPFMVQNFDYIQLSKLEYDNNEYFILLTEKDNGYFEYPSIYRGWISFKETTFLILTKDEIKEINEYISSPKDYPFIIKKSPKIADEINNKFKKLGGEYSYTKEVLMSRISKSIKNINDPSSKVQYSYFSFPLFSTLENNKHVIRFKVPFYNFEKSNYNSIGKDLFSIRIGTDSLEYDYFEVPVEEFKKIFTII